MLSTGSIINVPISKKGLRFSHLFFVDDSLLFCKTNSMDWHRLVQLLDEYKVAFGQKLNKEKTSFFFFFPNVGFPSYGTI